METLAELRKKPHISFSQIGAYIACPAKYYYSYVKKMWDTTTPSGLAFGTAVHDSLAEMYKEMLKGRLMTSDGIKACFADMWKKQSGGGNGNGGGKYAPKAVSYKKDESYDLLLILGQTLVGHYVKLVPKDITVLAVEEPLSLVVVEGIPPLIGAIDLIYEESTSAIKLVDHKTTASKTYWNQARANSDPQITAYSVWAKARMGSSYARVSYRFDALLKDLSTPEVISLDTTRSDQDRELFIKLVNTFWRGVQNQVFFRVESWKCNDCSYKELCVKDFV